MKNKIDVVLPLVAALLVLFSSMWRAKTTLVVSIGSLLILSIYSLIKRDK